MSLHHEIPVYKARIIDIDILLYDQKLIDTDSLSIPHPKLHERMFVLKPLQEIAASVLHPGLNKTIKELFTECGDKLIVKKFT